MQKLDVLDPLSSTRYTAHFLLDPANINAKLKNMHYPRHIWAMLNRPYECNRELWELFFSHNFSRPRKKRAHFQHCSLCYLHTKVCEKRKMNKIKSVTQEAGDESDISAARKLLSSSTEFSRAFVFAIPCYNVKVEHSLLTILYYAL